MVVVVVVVVVFVVVVDCRRLQLKCHNVMTFIESSMTGNSLRIEIEKVSPENVLLFVYFPVDVGLTLIQL